MQRSELLLHDFDPFFNTEDTFQFIFLLGTEDGVGEK